ncbi:esterase/lipase family protein [Nocardia cerradoensis]|uniref:esterase/lipase family protein n=1 Tax=Nocardia cerradoensis TaxID=85688 RepID=UPI0009FF9FA5|nr:alpha/beta fold hydrolase [Nocardia cerradoensis]NKY42408.1 alpha/beta fold hydrolase [Nocardia cerradoensis]
MGRGRNRRDGGLAWRRALAAVAACGAAFGGSTNAWAEPSPPPDTRPAVVPTEWGPPQGDHLAASRYLKAHPGATPWGTNDFTCRPGAQHPRPIILAHGTDATAYTDWSGIGPQLVAAGFCVFAPNYGGKPDATSYGTEDLWASSRQFGDFVDRVLSATGADKVELVGFSQGANITRYYVDRLGGAPYVDQWIGLASPSYGGQMYGLVPLADAMPGLWNVYQQVTSLAAVQQAQGSPFIRELDAGSDTVPGVRYTTVGSRVDEMIQPSGNIALTGPGARNLVLQDLCPIDLTGHFHMVYDPYVQQLLLTLLDPEHAPLPQCAYVPLGTGIGEVILGAHS